jgi:AhpD family alkylhydroperoxidase
MQSRMKNPALMIPEALQALRALDKTTHQPGLPHVTQKLVQLRASQINGCSVCVDMHSRELKQAGEQDTRIFAVGAWRDTPYFNDAERAALALTEAVTRLADQSDAVPDELWAEVSRHYEEPARAALILTIAQINLWNRLNAAVRQMAGASWS